MPKEVANGQEREKIRKIVPISFYPTWNKELPKKFKKLKNTILASFQAKISWERLRKRENRKNHFDVFLPDQE